MPVDLDPLKAAFNSEGLRLRDIVWQVTLPLMVLDPALKIVFTNKAYQSIIGLSEGALHGSYLFDAIPLSSDAREEVESKFRRSLAGEVTHLDIRPRPDAGGIRSSLPRHWLAVQEPIRNSGGEVVFVLHRAQDITEQVILQRSNDLVTAELDHRVQNLMTVILATVRLSGHGGVSIEQYTEDLCSRLESMSRNHSMLSSRGLQGLTLREIFQDEFAHAPSRYTRRYTLKGEDMPLRHRASKDGCMVIHELVSNAVKHGCFSVPDGWLNIEWMIQGDDLRVVWHETGMSGVKEPEKLGFGSRLLEMLPNARVNREFRETGLWLEYLVPTSIAIDGGAETGGKNG